MNNLQSRKEVIAHAAPERHSQLRAAAESLNRRNVDGAVLELMSEAVQRLTLLAYEQDEGGYCNIDAVTNRLLIPAPWGRAGYARWGLRAAESVVLREIMQRRQVQRKNSPPGLFLYDRAGRTWRLNRFDFENYNDAESYWARWPLGMAEYRAARAERVGR